MTFKENRLDTMQQFEVMGLIKALAVDNHIDMRPIVLAKHLSENLGYEVGREKTARLMKKMGVNYRKNNADKLDLGDPALPVDDISKALSDLEHTIHDMDRKLNLIMSAFGVKWIA